MLSPGSVEYSTLAGIEGGLAVDVLAQAADRGEDAVADGLHPLDVTVVRIELKDDRLAAAGLQTIGPECLSYCKARAGLGIVDLPVLKAGKAISYRGPSGARALLPNGDPSVAAMGLWQFGADDQIAPVDEVDGDVPRASLA